MRWRTAFGRAVRANPRLSAMIAFELGLLFYAACKARQGRPASIPPAEAFVSAGPLVVEAMIKRKRR